jgi:hypothetical protein
MRIRTSASAIAAALVLVAAGPVTSAGARAANPWTQTVFALGPQNSYVAEYTGSGWTVIGGAGTQLLAGENGVFEVVPNGDIERYDGTPNDWTVIGGPGAQFAEGGGSLYAIGPNDAYVAQWDGLDSGWSQIGGPAVQIYAGGDGLVATSPDGYDAYRYDGTPGQWSLISDSIDSGPFVVGTSSIYVIQSPNRIVYQWDGSGTSWTQIAGPTLDLYAGATGVFMTPWVDLPPGVYQYDGTPEQWTLIGGYGGEFVSSASTLYGLGPADDYVGEWSGSGTGWTQIGGPAWAIAAGS